MLRHKISSRIFRYDVRLFSYRRIFVLKVQFSLELVTKNLELTVLMARIRVKTDKCIFISSLK